MLGTNPSRNKPFILGTNPSRNKPYILGDLLSRNKPFILGTNPSRNKPYILGTNPSRNKPFILGTNSFLLGTNLLFQRHFFCGTHAVKQQGWNGCRLLTGQHTRESIPATMVGSCFKGAIVGAGTGSTSGLSKMTPRKTRRSDAAKRFCFPCLQIFLKSLLRRVKGKQGSFLPPTL